MSLIKEFNVDKLCVKVYDTRKAMGEKAADQVSYKIRELLAKQSEVNIIFAAAPSQNEFLDTLVSIKDIEWGRINAFHMDEYVGVDTFHPLSLATFLREKLFNKVTFKSVNLMDGMAGNIEAECERYSELLEKFPTDIVCMGIGDNAHIAFNDPHVADFNDKKFVKMVDIDDISKNQQANGAGFDKAQNVPPIAMTITIPGLMAAKYTYCVVPTKVKAQAAFNSLNGDITEKFPASILRRQDNAVLYLERESASLL